MIKRLIALVLALMCVGCFFGCSEDSGFGSGKNDKKVDTKASNENIDIKALKNSIITELEIEGAMDMGNAILLSYGIDEKDIKESASFITEGGAFTSEAIIIKAVDDDAAERIAEKLEVRLKALLEQSKNYSADDYAIAKECEVKVYGQVITLFFAPNHKGMTEVAESILE